MEEPSGDIACLFCGVSGQIATRHLDMNRRPFCRPCEPCVKKLMAAINHPECRLPEFTRPKDCHDERAVYDTLTELLIVQDGLWFPRIRWAWFAFQLCDATYKSTMAKLGKGQKQPEPDTMPRMMRRLRAKVFRPAGWDIIHNKGRLAMYPKRLYDGVASD